MTQLALDARDLRSGGPSLFGGSDAAKVLLELVRGVLEEGGDGGLVEGVALCNRIDGRLEVPLETAPLLSVACVCVCARRTPMPITVAYLEGAALCAKGMHLAGAVAANAMQALLEALELLAVAALVRAHLVVDRLEGRRDGLADAFACPLLLLGGLFLKLFYADHQMWSSR